MAAISESLFIQLPVVLLLYSLLISASAATFSSPTLPPTADYNLHNQELISTFPPTLLASILSALGFQELSSVTVAANVSNNTPLTIFAPSDSSLLTCSSCSLPLLLKEHSVPGLYPLRFLRDLAFGAKIETLAADYCLTITTSNAEEESDGVFVNGVRITHPDLFNNGVIMIHGLHGFVSHLSPLSCNVERMTSLSFSEQSPVNLPLSAQFCMMRLMLNDAIIRLRHSGYNMLALALKVKYKEFSMLKAMSLFALDDLAVFSDTDVGYAYLSNFLFHVVPNRKLMTAELVSLPKYTLLPTMQVGQNLVVTTSARGVSLAPVNINYVRITTLDLLHNSRIVVHALSTPFPHMHHHHYTAPKELHSYSEENMKLPETCELECSGGLCEVEASVPTSSINSADVDDHHWL